MQIEVKEITEVFHSKSDQMARVQQKKDGKPRPIIAKEKQKSMKK